MMKLSTTLGALMLALGLMPFAAQAQSAPNTQTAAATAPGKAGAAVKNIKKGDHVQVTYVEALAIAVAEAPARK